jgi:hypothetical protein
MESTVFLQCKKFEKSKCFVFLNLKFHFMPFVSNDDPRNTWKRLKRGLRKRNKLQIWISPFSIECATERDYLTLILIVFGTYTVPISPRERERYNLVWPVQKQFRWSRQMLEEHEFIVRLQFDSTCLPGCLYTWDVL